MIEVLGNSNEKQEKAEGKLQPKLQAEMFSKINSTNSAKYYLKENEKERETSINNRLNLSK